MLGVFLNHIYTSVINKLITVYLLKVLRKQLKKKNIPMLYVNGKHVRGRKKGQRQEKLDFPIYEKMSSTDFIW